VNKIAAGAAQFAKCILLHAYSVEWERFLSRGGRKYKIKVSFCPQICQASA